MVIFYTGLLLTNYPILLLLLLLLLSLLLWHWACCNCLCNVSDYLMLSSALIWTVASWLHSSWRLCWSIRSQVVTTTSRLETPQGCHNTLPSKARYYSSPHSYLPPDLGNWQVRSFLFQYMLRAQTWSDNCCMHHPPTTHHNNFWLVVLTPFVH